MESKQFQEQIDSLLKQVDSLKRDKRLCELYSVIATSNNTIIYFFILLGCYPGINFTQCLCGIGNRDGSFTYFDVKTRITFKRKLLT